MTEAEILREIKMLKEIQRNAGCPYCRRPYDGEKIRPGYVDCPGCGFQFIASAKAKLRLIDAKPGVIYA